jgi:hypothetical protein
MSVLLTLTLKWDNFRTQKQEFFVAEIAVVCCVVAREELNDRAKLYQTAAR